MKIISQLFSPKNRDLLKKILFTLLALFIFKLGTSITVPGATISTKNLSFFEILNWHPYNMISVQINDDWIKSQERIRAN